MRATWIWMCASLMLLSLRSVAAVPLPAGTELTMEKAEEGSLSASKGHNYGIPLHAGDMVQIRLDPHGAEVVMLAYAPSGQRARGARLGPDADDFQFIAEAEGRYTLELSLPEDAKSKYATYSLTWKKRVPLAERLEPVKAKEESPRIAALKSALESGNKAAVAAFWEEVGKSGGPLIERLPDEAQNMLVTFLWKGSATTKNVLIVWFPYAMQSPDKYRLVQIGDSGVWYRSVKVEKRKRFIYRLAENAPNFRSSDDGDDLFSTIFAGSQIDPLNKNHWAADPSDPDVPEHQGFSAVEMPDAPPQPWGTHKKGVPEGKVERHMLASALMKNEREIGVYLPAGYSRLASAYGLLVLFDENAYLKNEKQSARVPTEAILDNLIAEKRIPPMVAVFVDNGPGDARSRELPCNPAFADFLNVELVPWLRRLYNITTDPHHVVVGGSSYGGLASTYAALRHPETFGNVLSQSGSYWWTPPKTPGSSDFDSNAEPNWVAKQFIASPKLPVRFYMDAGSDEIDLSGKGSSILVPNRHLRDVLLAKGYEVHYQEFNGGHDYLSWRGTLADGLILLMGSSAAEAPKETSQKAASDPVVPAQK
jgi:enterochelin esterase-like enzyme